MADPLPVMLILSNFTGSNDLIAGINLLTANMEQTIFEKITQEMYEKWVDQPPVRDNTSGEVCFIKGVLNLSYNDVVFDLFCALGRHVIPLVAEGFNVIGIDKSSVLLAKAKEAASLASVSAQFVCADLLDFSSKDKADAVYSIQSSLFEAWRPPEEVLELLSRVHTMLKSGGKYLFGWPHNWCRSDYAESKTRQHFRELGILDFDNRELPFHFYGLSEQRDLLLRAGFQVNRLFNRYDIYEPYDEQKPGLIISATRIR
jgi:SAM-dependent methyltransferase